MKIIEINEYIYIYIYIYIKFEWVKTTKTQVLYIQSILNEKAKIHTYILLHISIFTKIFKIE